MSDFLKVAIEAATQAESVILEHFHPNVAVERKADNSPVTIADKEAERIIRLVITEHFPDHSIMGEEQGSDTKASRYTWVIDPIDGTKNYTRHIPIFGTLVALFEDDRPIIGVSNMPALKEMLYAESGGGAFKNGEKIQVSDISKLEDAYIAYGGLSRFEDKGLTKSLLQLCNATLAHRGFGDCWMFQLLAEGKVDIVIEAKMSPWDGAAGAAIIQEAGGICTDLEGRPISPTSTSMVAANKHLHAQVMEMVKV